MEAFVTRGALRVKQARVGKLAGAGDKWFQCVRKQ